MTLYATGFQQRENIGLELETGGAPGRECDE
jgi:hypothetical protein